MRISSSIHLIEEASGCNVYLVENKELTLIDTGMPGNLEAVEEYIEGLDRNMEDLSHILLTHSHFDHVSSAPEIIERTGAKTLAHELDSPYISGKKKRGILIRMGDFIFRKPKFKVDIQGKGGEEFLNFEVINTPGHTEGSVSFFYPKEKALFVGDAIGSDTLYPFGEEGKLSLSPQIFSENTKDMKNSVKRMREIEPNLLLPGHGSPISEEVIRQLDELITDF